jgi:hypothetical protein
MQIALAIFPVGEGAARLHRHVGVAGGSEGAFVDVAGGGKSSFQFTVGPFCLRFRGWFGTVSESSHLVSSPVVGGKSLAEYKGITPVVSLGAARLHAVQRIQHVVQSFEGHRDCFKSVLGSFFIDRGHRQDRLTDQGWLVSQNFQAGAVLLTVRIHVVSSENAKNTIHRQRFGRIDIDHPRVGNGAGQQPDVRHAFPGIVLCVLDPAGDLAGHIGWNKIFTYMLISHGDHPISTARMTPRMYDS